MLTCAIAGALWTESNLQVRNGPPEDRPSAAPPTSMNAEWRAVQIAARDGEALYAWLLRPRSGNGSCVVALHGLGGDRVGMLRFAPIFLENGYAVLMPDNRGRGESGGDIITYGAWEADDVHRWVDWVVANEHPREIFGFGMSLGGEVLVQSLAVESRFSAIVADSPFSDLRSVATERLAKRVAKIAAATIVESGFICARLRYGVDLRQAACEPAIRATKTPVLLIHGMEDRRTSAHNSQILAAENPQRVTLWLLPGVGHAGAFDARPDEYRRRVIAWFADHTQGRSASQ